VNRAVRALLDIALKSIGFRQGINGFVRVEKYDRLAREMYGCLTETVFGDLPSCGGRMELILQLQGTGVSESVYLLDQLHRSLACPGDVCEFGVAQGATSALLSNEIRHTEKTIWLFDTFEGLPRPTKEDVLVDDLYSLGSIEKYEGLFSYSAREVRRRLLSVDFPLNRARLVHGRVEETVHRADLPDRVCFAFIDLDFYKGTQAVLDLLHSRLSLGGRILVDDYGYFSGGVKTAVDEFTARHPSQFDMVLPPDFAGKFCILLRTQ